MGYLLHYLIIILMIVITIWLYYSHSCYYVCLCIADQSEKCTDFTGKNSLCVLVVSSRNTEHVGHGMTCARNGMQIVEQISDCSHYMYI